MYGISGKLPPRGCIPARTKTFWYWACGIVVIVVPGVAICVLNRARQADYYGWLTWPRFECAVAMVVALH
jgi:hypothetical protein